MNETTELLTAEERRRARGRAYYWAHRDQICQRQRENYRSIDKAAHAARVRKYRQEHHERNLEIQRAYRANHRERIQELNRLYHERHREEQNASRRKYWQEHREELLKKKRIYNATHKEQRKAYLAAHPEKAEAYRAARREKKQEYYRRNRYKLCKQKLETDCYRSMTDIQQRCPEKVEQYMQRWPFEHFADRRIKGQLRWWNIKPQHRLYDDCYDAGMLAYLYSIHRCALMGYQHVEQYTAKMIKIMVICALHVGRGPGEQCSMENLQISLPEPDGFAL